MFYRFFIYELLMSLSLPKYIGVTRNPDELFSEFPPRSLNNPLLGRLSTAVYRDLVTLDITEYESKSFNALVNMPSPAPPLESLLFELNALIISL